MISGKTGLLRDSFLKKGKIFLLFVNLPTYLYVSLVSAIRIEAEFHVNKLL